MATTVRRVKQEARLRRSGAGAGGSGNASNGCGYYASSNGIIGSDYLNGVASLSSQGTHLHTPPHPSLQRCRMPPGV